MKTENKTMCINCHCQAIQNAIYLMSSFYYDDTFQLTIENKIKLNETAYMELYIYWLAINNLILVVKFRATLSLSNRSSD